MNMQKVIQITRIENLIPEYRSILKNVSKIGSQQNNFGITIHPLHGQDKDNHTIVYRQKKYILIVPKGNKIRSFMYGSCEEALYASKRFLAANSSVQMKLQVSIR
jgi:hypothetical protein